jgi:hypothetical protein
VYRQSLLPASPNDRPFEGSTDVARMPPEAVQMLAFCRVLVKQWAACAGFVRKAPAAASRSLEEFEFSSLTIDFTRRQT